MKMNYKNILIIVFCFFASTLIGYYTYFNIPDNSPDNSDVELNIPDDFYAEDALVTIFIGCSTCPAANASYLPDLVNSLNDSLRNISNKNGYNFIKIGVSKDYDLDNGINYLRKFNNEFDEISVGSEWQNTAVINYVWAFDSRALTPKFIILKRSLLLQDDDDIVSNSSKKVEEKIIANLDGSSQMLYLKQNLNELDFE